MGDALSAEDLAALAKMGGVKAPPPAAPPPTVAAPPPVPIEDPDAGDDPDALPPPTALAVSDDDGNAFGPPHAGDPDDEGPALGDALDALEGSIDEFDEAVEKQWKPRPVQSDDDPVEHSWTAPLWLKRLRSVIANVEDSILAMEKLLPDEDAPDTTDSVTVEADGADVGTPDGEPAPAAEQPAPRQRQAAQPTGPGLTLDEGILLQQLCMNLAALHHIITVAHRKEFQRCIRNLPSQMRQAVEGTLAAAPQFVEAGSAIVQMRSGVSLEAARQHTEAMMLSQGMTLPSPPADADPDPDAAQGATGA